MRNRLAHLFHELDRRDRVAELEEKIILIIQNYRAQVQGLRDLQKEEKRQIRALLKEMKVEVKPGSPLSRLLRLDTST